MDPFPHIEPQPAGFSQEEQDAYARAMERLRADLGGYVRSLLLHAETAADVVQDTMIFLWERREKTSLERLRATAFRVAWFKCLSVRRDGQREKLVHLSDEAFQRVAGAAEEIAEETDIRLDALRACLVKLPPKDRQLLNIRYGSGGNLAEMARRSGVSPNRLQKTVSRLRIVLRHCMETSLSLLS